MNNTLRTALLAIGTLFVVGGLLLAFVVVPSMKVFPDDVDIDREYNVEYLTLLDSDTMEFQSFSRETSPDLRIERNVKGEDSTEDMVLVRETMSFVHNGDEVIRTVVKSHVLDRKTLEFVGDVPEDWKESEGFAQRAGLIIGWGLDSEAKDYRGWSDDYNSTVDLVYQNEEEHNGITTYYYISESGPQPIAPEYVEFLQLPAALSVDQIKGLAEGLPIEDPTSKQLATSLLPIWIEEAVRQFYDVPEGEPAMVPLVYAYDYVGEYWVEPQTGVLIDTHKIENRTATFPPEVMEYLRGKLETLRRDPATLDSLLPVTVNAFEYRQTQKSQDEAVDNAQESLDQITLFGTYVPIGLVVLGVICGGGGLLGAGRKNAVPAQPSLSSKS